MDEHQNLRDDHASDCRSFGSIYHPSSQSRKISIGIMADSVAKTRPGATKEDVVRMPNAGKVVSKGENSIERNKKGKGVTMESTGKQVEVTNLENSPWIATKSFYRETLTPTTNSVHCGKQTSSIPFACGMLNKVDGADEVPAAYSVQVFANKTSILQAVDGKQKRFDKVTYRKKEGVDGATERLEEFTFATAHETSVLDKEVITDRTKKTEDQSSKALRMKIWETLETVQPPNVQNSSSQTLNTIADNSKPEQNFEPTGSKVYKRRQNSDTIETDSESIDHTIRRPLTRSLARKKGQKKVQQKKNNGPSPKFKQTHNVDNIFSFEEGWSGRLQGAANGGSSMPKETRNEKKSCRIEPRKIHFLEKENMVNIQKATGRKKTEATAERSSSLGSRLVGSHGYHRRENQEYLDTDNGIKEKASYHSTEKKGGQKSEHSRSTLPDSPDRQEVLHDISLNQQVDYQTPKYGAETPVKSISPSSPPRTNQVEQDVRSPAPGERRSTVEDIFNFRSSLPFSPDDHDSEKQTESSDDSGVLKESPIRKSMQSTGDKDADNRMSTSSPEERNTESSEEGSPVIEGCRVREAWSPETGTATADKPKFMLRPTKRLCSHQGIKSNEYSPAPVSPKVTGTETSNGFQEPFEQNQEDGLTRAVALFASALKGLESKVKSLTAKKTSEILMSVAEGINLQLQSIESQIQMDIGKLINIGKSKRKRLEARFQEKQEQLKLIHEKFIEEVNQHLQDCRSTVEGLEAHQIEFKGTMERQKASHRKMLLQVEEAIDTQLNDAQRRITGIRKSGGEKMVQLKHLIGDCVKEGILT